MAECSKFCGPERARTADLLLAKQALYPRHITRGVRLQQNRGDDRGRTGGLLLAKQALYQLSYVPGLAGPPGPVAEVELQAPNAVLPKNGGPKRNCTSDPSVISTVLY